MTRENLSQNSHPRVKKATGRSENVYCTFCKVNVKKTAEQKIFTSAVWSRMFSATPANDKRYTKIFARSCMAQKKYCICLGEATHVTCRKQLCAPKRKKERNVFVGLDSVVDTTGKNHFNATMACLNDGGIQL